MFPVPVLSLAHGDNHSILSIIKDTDSCSVCSVVMSQHESVHKDQKKIKKYCMDKLNLFKTVRTCVISIPFI